MKSDYSMVLLYVAHTVLGSEIDQNISTKKEEITRFSKAPNAGAFITPIVVVLLPIVVIYNVPRFKFVYY